MGLRWQKAGVCATLHVFIYVVEEISREKKCFRPIKIWFGDFAYLFIAGKIPQILEYCFRPIEI